LKAVFDTNVLVSAVLSDGVCRKLLAHLPAGRLRLLLSPDTTQEFLAVLNRPKFGLASGQAEQILAQDLLPFSDVVQPSNALLQYPCRDPKEDKFLSCALAGQAIFLVTGDLDLLELKSRYKFEIIEPRAALEKHFKKSGI
jgi:putative PIN family toxin of toxin-antitoxin system